MTDYKEYPEYKASGVEWIPQIPSTWSLRKVENIANFLTGGTPPTGVSEYFEGDCTWVSISDLNNGVVLDSKKSLSTEGVRIANIPVSPEGSLLFSFKLSVGKVAIAGKDLYTNEAIATFMPSDKLETKFAFYSFPCTVVKSAKKNIYNADLLNSSMIREAKVPLPPLETQQEIVKFLDRETAHIDAGIANMESLIALLTEKRSALISEVVTRGIPGEHTEFKDSDVEWLGEIPVGWELPRFKNVITVEKRLNGGMKNRNLLSLSYGELKKKDINSPNGLLPESFEGYQIIKKNELVFRFMDLQNDKRSLRSAINRDTDGIITSAYLVAHVRKDNVLDHNFFAYLMRGYDLKKVFYGIGTGLRESVGNKEIASLPITLPTLQEQKKIVNYLDKETEKIDSLIAITKLSISLLKEKRQTLISDVVTGKIDVTNSAN